MVDRQDIDALLVGSLYGELTPADEARLAAHLESHPADRAALEDLKSARQAVHASRIFQDQVEPPQAVSALLLQEAHRRAPKPVRVREGEEHESWFARLARSFFAHPAMAAAAMLVIVIGVAGTIYMKKGGDEFANQEVGAPAEEMTAGPPAAAPAPTGGKDLEAAGSAAYQVQLAEGQAGKLAADRDEADKLRQQTPHGKADTAKNEPELALDDGVGSMRKAPAPAKHESKKYVEVRTPEAAMPKDLDAPKPASRSKGAATGIALDGDTRGAIGGAGAAPGGGGVNGFAEPPTATAAPGRAPAQAPAPPPPPAAKPTAPAPTTAPSVAAGPQPQAQTAPQPQSTALLGWAKGQLAHAIELARDLDKCREVAQVTRAIHDRAPAFYAQEVADNRELRGCAQYMRAQVEQAEERAKRAAPAKANLIDNAK